MLPELNIAPPKVNQIQCTREELPVLYAQVLNQNPLLARIEGSCRTIGWTDAEIRTMQLLAACRSNGSLTQRLQELEQSLGK
jgi:hypothetical protein